MDKDLNYHIALYKKVNSDKTITIISVDDKFVYFKTKYGECKKRKDRFLTFTLNHSILSAINKNEYLLNIIKEIFKDEYDYSLVEYKKSNEKISLICKKHGVFDRTLSNLIHRKEGCPICNEKERLKKVTHTTEQFIQKANKVHHFKYDYNLANYKGLKYSINISCKKHGIFNQQANSHLNGAGCPKCGLERTIQSSKENSPSWTITNWNKAGEKSKNFTGFKCYIIECWNENERFFKIGRTFLDVSKRFNHKKALPYNWKLIKIFEGNAKEIHEMETFLKRKNKNYKYIPLLEFKGMYECFSNYTT